MNARLTAVLIHGMNNSRSWWNPFVPGFNDAGITPCALEMPPLDAHLPQAWVDDVCRAIDHVQGPCALIGHSLGAAVALEAALVRKVDFVILLGMPDISVNAPPEAPADNGLSASALARVGLFLRQTAGKADALKGLTAVNICGQHDAWRRGSGVIGALFSEIIIPDADHRLNESPAAIAAVLTAISDSAIGMKALDPGRRIALLRGGIAGLGLQTIAPRPARLDIEITNRCQLSCAYCARTLLGAGYPAVDMDEALFGEILDRCPSCEEVVFVGLGEPLLHQSVAGLVRMSRGRGMRARLITNGLLANEAMVNNLMNAGLDQLTFSVDAADAETFKRVRGGANFLLVKQNLVDAALRIGVSVFTTVSKESARALKSVVELAHAIGLPAIAVSDLNFPENIPFSCHGSLACEKELAEALSQARELGVILLGPHIHDYANLTAALRPCALRNPGQIMHRTKVHTHCLAPWRTLVVGCRGEITPCNCAPTHSIGAICNEPFEGLWNGESMQAWRRSMLSGDNETCKSCPRY